MYTFNPNDRTIAFATSSFAQVSKRQEKVQAAAIKSNAIVSSLFPKEIRKRLFEEASATDDGPKNKKKNNKKKRNSTANDSDAPKLQLQNYLDDDDDDSGGKNKNESQIDDDEMPEMFESKPIADLVRCKRCLLPGYETSIGASLNFLSVCMPACIVSPWQFPNTTVMFAGKYHCSGG